MAVTNEKEGLMQYVLFVFSARDGAMALYDYCLTHRIAAAVVNTPRELAASCGISVKTSTRDTARLQRVVTKLPTYVGAYLVSTTLTHRSIVRLYN